MIFNRNFSDFFYIFWKYSLYRIIYISMEDQRKEIIYIPFSYCIILLNIGQLYYHE